jgi:division protein CdvB (Snf7/Vps24/ESCRT-III family)
MKKSINNIMTDDIRKNIDIIEENTALSKQRVVATKLPDKPVTEKKIMEVSAVILGHMDEKFDVVNEKIADLSDKVDGLMGLPDKVADLSDKVDGLMGLHDKVDGLMGLHDKVENVTRAIAVLDDNMLNFDRKLNEVLEIISGR